MSASIANDRYKVSIRCEGKDRTYVFMDQNARFGGMLSGTVKELLNDLITDFPEDGIDYEMETVSPTEALPEGTLGYPELRSFLTERMLGLP